jgi:D-alanyl-D-alanine carboxypeptidase/D-alanyl-D-alanine-endopeptidase (penicillin-binding protein 4)
VGTRWSAASLPHGPPARAAGSTDGVRVTDERRGRGRRALVAVLAVGALLAGAGAYAVADVRGRVPGPLTDDPVPQAYPEVGTAPAAVEPGPWTPGSSAPLDAAAPAPDPAALAAALGPLLADPALGARVGASVVDPVDGRALLDVSGGAVFEPASVAKVLTGAAALHRLGPDHVLTTTVRRDGADLYLVGGGDLLLGPGAGDPTSVVGRAGLGDLAEQVGAALRTSSTAGVRLHLDDSVLGGLGWGGAATGPGVVPADLAAGYVAPVTGLALDAGRLRRETYAPRVADPGLAAAATFAEELARAGVPVVAGPARGRAPEGASQVGSVASAPLGEVVAHTLASSDNDVAEALSRLVALDAGAAPGFATGGAAVLAAVAELGVPVEGAVLADGSGLSDGSRLAPRTLTTALAVAASDEHPQLRGVLTGLPVAALTGTLAPRFAEPEAAAGRGLVRAKTGSLTGTSSLAGTVVDADGRLLAFSVMVDAASSTVAARAALDRVAAALAACGCR